MNRRRRGFNTGQKGKGMEEEYVEKGKGRGSTNPLFFCALYFSCLVGQDYVAFSKNSKGGGIHAR